MVVVPPCRVPSRRAVLGPVQPIGNRAFEALVWEPEIDRDILAPIAGHIHVRPIPRVVLRGRSEQTQINPLGVVAHQLPARRYGVRARLRQNPAGVPNRHNGFGESCEVECRGGRCRCAVVCLQHEGSWVLDHLEEGVLHPVLISAGSERLPIGTSPVVSHRLVVVTSCRIPGSGRFAVVIEPIGHSTIQARVWEPEIDRDILALVAGHIHVRRVPRVVLRGRSEQTQINPLRIRTHQLPIAGGIWRHLIRHRSRLLFGRAASRHQLGVYVEPAPVHIQQGLLGFNQIVASSDVLRGSSAAEWDGFRSRQRRRSVRTAARYDLSVDVESASVHIQ